MAFILPYQCACGANGIITFEIYEDGSGEPQPRIAEIEGPFRAVGESGLGCLKCEGREDEARYGSG